MKIWKLQFCSKCLLASGTVCECACAWMGSLLFKNLWSEFFAYFSRPFFSPSDCSPPPQQSDILFAVEFDRLRWQELLQDFLVLVGATTGLNKFPRPLARGA